MGFHCGRCGEWHDDLPMSFGAEEPEYYHEVPEAERDTRCQLDGELCIVDDEHFFIRGCLEIPVLDGPGPFVWGVWASLARGSFKHVMQLWADPERHEQPPYFGWLQTELPGYPGTTLNLKTLVHSRPVGQRPRIELEPTDHPLAVEQREGITMARVQQIVEALLHGEL